MNAPKNETFIRNLTVAQLDSLRAVLISEKAVISSQNVSKLLKHGSGKSLSSLASLANMKTPLVKKVGKMSAREGCLWIYDDEFLPKDKAITIVKDIFDTLYASGVLKK